MFAVCHKSSGFPNCTDLTPQDGLWDQSGRRSVFWFSYTKDEISNHCWILNFYRSNFMNRGQNRLEKNGWTSQNVFLQETHWLSQKHSAGYRIHTKRKKRKHWRRDSEPVLLVSCFFQYAQPKWDLNGMSSSSEGSAVWLTDRSADSSPQSPYINQAFSINDS